MLPSRANVLPARANVLPARDKHVLIKQLHLGMLGGLLGLPGGEAALEGLFLLEQVFDDCLLAVQDAIRGADGVLRRARAREVVCHMTRTTTGCNVRAQSSKLPMVSLPKRSLRVPKPSALRSWYVRASEPMTPAFLLCLPIVRQRRTHWMCWLYCLLCGASYSITRRGLLLFVVVGLQTSCQHKAARRKHDTFTYTTSKHISIGTDCNCTLALVKPTARCRAKKQRQSLQRQRRRRNSRLAMTSLGRIWTRRNRTPTRLPMRRRCALVL